MLRRGRLHQSASGWTVASIFRTGLAFPAEQTSDPCCRRCKPKTRVATVVTKNRCYCRSSNSRRCGTVHRRGMHSGENIMVRVVGFLLGWVPVVLAERYKAGQFRSPYAAVFVHGSGICGRFRRRRMVRPCTAYRKRPVRAVENFIISAATDAGKKHSIEEKTGTDPVGRGTFTCTG